MRRIDLNVDIGEGFPYDEELLEFATSANICCGEHAGSWELTLLTIELCRNKGVRIGMHPGYADRESLGRRNAEAAEFPELRRSLLGQAHEFMEARPAAYVKPHGAWYNQIVGGATLGRFDPAAPLIAIVREYKIPAMLLPTYRGLPAKWLIREGFADRAYREDGTLVPRSEPNAVLHDPKEVARQAVRLAESVDSICLHGDTPRCVAFAKLVREALESAGYEVGS